MKATLELKSNFGFISDRTVSSLISFVKKKDVGFSEIKQRGLVNNMRILYIESSLNPEQVRNILTKFISRYDYLYFKLNVNFHCQLK